MSFFKPSRTADFLRSRTLFFVCALSLNLVWSIVAALDVSSADTKRSSHHVAVGAYNLTIQLFSFFTIACITILDSIVETHSNRWYSHVIFECFVYCFLATLQLAGALAFSALVSQFYCSAADGPSSCLSFNRALLVGSWTISIVYILFALWFSFTVFSTSKHDPTVWRSRTKSYDWEAAAGYQTAKLITPSSPMEIIGSGHGMAQVKNKIRVTWIIPSRRYRGPVDSTPHLPIQAIPPATPAVPPLPLAYARQSVPEDVSLQDSSRLRPLSLVQSQLEQQQQTPVMTTKKSKFMSIKPLRLHRPSASVDKASLGFTSTHHRGLTISRPKMSPTEYSEWNANEDAQSWLSNITSVPTTYGREQITSQITQSTTRQYVNSSSMQLTPSTPRSYSTGTTVPPTPPPKDFLKTHPRTRPGQYGSLDSLYPSSSKTRRYI